MRVVRTLFVCLALAAVLGCGLNSVPSSPSGAGNTFVARVDGIALQATSVSGSRSPGAPGFVSLQASGVVGAGRVRFSLSLSPSTGVQALGGGGAFATLTMRDAPIGEWVAGAINAPGSGSVTVDVLTATRARGTFSLVLAPLSGTAGPKRVDDGMFDVTLNAIPQ